MFREIFVLLGVSLLALVSARTSCRLDSQCGSAECCYYHEGPLIMSRKRNLPSAIDLSLMHQGGYCEAYRNLHESCSVFGKMNGHCECGPGLSCQFVPATTAMMPSAHIINKRSMILQGPGSYMCVHH